MNSSLPCNYERDNELNNRLNTRYFPSNALKPNLEFQSYSTKYTFNAKERISKQHSVEIDFNDNDETTEHKTFTTNGVFFPGNRRAPISHLVENIDTESTLRNQDNFLTKKDIIDYIPKNNSELYNVNNGFVENDALIYKTLQFQTKGTNNTKCDLAPNTFHNTTRMNIKNI